MSDESDLPAELIARLESDALICGSEPPRGQDWGDCWCTLPVGHEGLCFCEICTARHGAPGWKDPLVQ